MQQDINRRQQFFKQKGINEINIAPHIIQQSGLLRAAAAVANSSVFATIIEAPTYADPSADPETPEYAGRAYYTCRLMTDATAAYDEFTTYGLNDAVIASKIIDGVTYYLKYISKIANPPGNAGNEPADSPDAWEQSEEIRVSYGIGSDDSAGDLVISGFDIRDCVPAYKVDAVVQLISRTVGAATRYYIPNQFYTGAPIESSIRADLNHTDKITLAVFQ